MAPMEYLEAWGTLIHEKNLKSKISCQTPFKGCADYITLAFTHQYNSAADIKTLGNMILVPSARFPSSNGGTMLVPPVPRMSALFFHRLPICERATDH